RGTGVVGALVTGTSVIPLRGGLFVGGERLLTGPGVDLLTGQGVDVTVGVGVGVLGVVVLVRGGPGSGGAHRADGGGVAHGVLVIPGGGRLVVVLTHDVVGLLGPVAA